MEEPQELRAQMAAVNSVLTALIRGERSQDLLSVLLMLKNPPIRVSYDGGNEEYGVCLMGLCVCFGWFRAVWAVVGAEMFLDRVQEKSARVAPDSGLVPVLRRCVQSYTEGGQQ